MKQDSTATLMQSVRRFFSGTMLSRFTGLFRDIAMASVFGTNATVAAFFVALRLAHLLRRILGEGALQSAFIPYFEGIRKNEPQRAGLFFRDLNIALAISLILFILISMALMGLGLSVFNISPGNREILWLTFLLMPSLLFICLFGINASLLQCERSYFISGVAPVAFNLVWIFGVWQLAGQPMEIGIYKLPFWIIFACLAQWLCTTPKIFAILKSYNLNIFAKGSLFQDVKKLWKPLTLAIIGVAASQVNNACDSLFARYSEPEGPAYLWYAMRLQQLPIGLLGVAISGALLPPLTRALKNNNLFQYQELLQFTLRKSLALMIPITFATLVLADSGINLLYGRGDFNNFSIVGTTKCLWGYAIGMVPMTLVLILASVSYAHQDAMSPAKASVKAMLLNLFLNTVFIFGLRWDATSVALSTSISAFANVGWLVKSLPAESLRFKQLIQISLPTIAASTLASLAVILFDYFFYTNTIFRLAFYSPLALPDAFVDQFSKLVFQCCVFSLTLLLSAWMIKAHDLKELILPSKKLTPVN